MRLRILYFITIVFLTIFLINYLYYRQAGAESNETGDYLVAEDWDIGTPPSNWPICGGSSWHGWVPKNFDCQWGDAELSTAIRYTEPRSLHLIRPAGDYDALSVNYTFSPNPKIHVRMYLYFGSGFQNSNVNGAEDCMHLLFFNSAVAFTGFGIDLRVYSDQYHQWPPTCNVQERSLYFTFHTSHNCSGGEDCYGPSNATDCWNILDHLEEWFCWEIMWDLSTNTAKMWINGDLKIDRTICSTNYSSINKVFLTIWNSTQIGYMHDVYMDNIVISDDYIGPYAPSGAPARPSNLRIKP